MNDPNGMVFSNGIYHLFFQYYPGATVWGPMHWGHATSKDLVHWSEQPAALYPDSLGYIFSGSIVVDKNNSSGFGRNGIAPLVAIFTHHNMEGEAAGRNNYQNQSLAYSNDDGKTWNKYAANPVLKNPGIADFRDPKIMWYAPQKKWIMTLATKDRVTFYSSANLKDWAKQSEFGAEQGAHGGVWECPDLFTLNHNGKLYWVLLVSIGRGGPNGGSATQYFLGEFDGIKFTTTQTEPKWIDYGPDNYAGVTWSNTGSRKIFLGWMSNWLYATKVPTTAWRSAMTIPRNLFLKHTGAGMFVAAAPVPELGSLTTGKIIKKHFSVAGKMNMLPLIKSLDFPCRINITAEKKDFSVRLFNNNGDEIVIGFNKNSNNFYIDRSKSGITNFDSVFAARHTAPRFSSNSLISLSLFIDKSSIELFADDGLTTMTEIFFPAEPFKNIQLQSAENLLVKKWEYIKLKSIH